MKLLCRFLMFVVASLPVHADDIAPPLPITDGQYIFHHKFAEHPNMESIKLVVTVRGRRISMVNNDESNVFPKGLLNEGSLAWHEKSGEWIILHSPEDLKAEEAGGCSDGPEVVDLVKKIYWTC